MYKFKIPIGDWSNDGHGKCEEFIIECNHPVEEVRQGYKDSCKLTGLSFNHNEDYTGLNLKYDNPEHKDRKIATDYEDNSISKLAETILKKHGMNVWKGYDMKVYNKEKDECWIDGSEHFIQLLFKFIKLSISDLEYTIVKDGLPYLNGYWNELNVQFGYGLFN